MRFLALASVLYLAEGSDTAGSSHDLLIGTIFTGTITLILGLVAAFATRRSSRVTVQSQDDEEDPRDQIIRDLRRDVRNEQRKGEHDAVRRRALYAEIDRLKDICRDNDIDWKTGERRQHT